MPSIHWIGVIEENKIQTYQKGNLDKRAVKMKMPRTMNEMMIKALPFLIPAIIILFSSTYFKSHIHNQIVIHKPFIFIVVLIGMAFLGVVHELLHAIVYPKGANVYIGIVKPINFVALVSYPLSKKRFILMCLLPYILGIIPYIAFWLSPADYLALNGFLIRNCSFWNG